MEGFRSKSCRDGRMQIEEYYGGKAGPTSMQDLRSYSVSYAGSTQPNQFGKEVKIKKGKSNLGSSSKSWSFNDPELQRKKESQATSKVVNFSLLLLAPKEARSGKLDSTIFLVSTDLHFLFMFWVTSLGYPESKEMQGEFAL
ncbi:hypothetical protein GH714_036166 [Hevea brasiliensis]|uniref:Uncharacterized protein n=1 Tax=Hevea brasiliensis TaxID=3981 RepID=A0A6A6NEK6_HEVBR|nr:hypothetical protein GH714_036166 [Hevea brasiliensis]